MSSVTNYHGFRFGDLDIQIVTDGCMTFTARNFFENAPEDELEAVLRRFGIYDRQITAPFNCLLVRGRGQTLLLDAGIGPTAAGATGRLCDGLRSALVSPEQVDVVLFSHGHADHVAGALASDGSLTFPRARHLIFRDEFDFWMTERSIEMAGARGRATQSKLQGLRDRLEFVEAEVEVLPGVRLLRAPGHTPGNCAVSIETTAGKLVYVADALAHPVQLERPDWYLNADLDPTAAVATRRRLLDDAAEAGHLVAGYHLALPAVGKIGKGRHGTYTFTPHWE